MSLHDSSNDGTINEFLGSILEYEATLDLDRATENPEIQNLKPLVKTEDNMAFPYEGEIFPGPLILEVAKTKG